MKKLLLLASIFFSTAFGLYAQDAVTENAVTPNENVTAAEEQAIETESVQEVDVNVTAPDSMTDTTVDTEAYESLAFNESKRQMSFYWLTLGLNGFVPINDKQDVPKTYYSLDFRVGMNFYKFFGGEVDFGYYMQDTRFVNSYNNVYNTISATRMDLKLYLMLSPEFKVVQKLTLIPYVGVGAVFAFLPQLDDAVYNNYMNSSNYDVSISVAAKLGLRMKISMFMIGVGAEYVNASMKYLGKKYDMSNFNIGAELGFVY